MSARNVQRVIGEFPPSPSAYTEHALFTSPVGEAELTCRYERHGSIHTSGLKFYGVHAFRYQAEVHCGLWHVDHAYDTLVEVEDSDWIDELIAADSTGFSRRTGIRHFLIYIDDAGAYEVAALSYEFLPETVC